MEKQRLAERTRRAVVTTAEATSRRRFPGKAKQSQTNAEGPGSGDPAADGRSSAPSRSAGRGAGHPGVAQAIGVAGNPAQYLIAQRYLESLGAIATGAQKLVFMPYEASGIMASLGGIRELLRAEPAK